MTSPEQRAARLTSIRNTKMARSAHAYVRGNTVNFYNWLESSGSRVPAGPSVWICGDCHLGNLGPVAASKGRVAVQIRDLDQTVIGNPAHDMIRLGLSLACAARGSDLPGITTARILEELVASYEVALGWEFDGKKDKSHRPKGIQKLLERSINRRWRHLALERLQADRAMLPKGKTFWALKPEERAGIVELFDQDSIHTIITRLQERDASESVALVDAAYWIKGCSSLGRLRYAVMLLVGQGKGSSLCLVDVKEGAKPAAPRAAGVMMPEDNAARVVQGAKALSPHLGDRMSAAQLLGASVVLRELKPQDLKIEVDRLSHKEATSLAGYLAGVVGRAHGRQMDSVTRNSWRAELARARTANLDAPSWLWSSVVELVSTHEAAYLDHCRRVLSNHRLIIDASIAEYGGRITSTAGDSVLAEFASVVSVINCAVQIQDLLAHENAQLDEAERLFLRIGINVGDVMMKDGDIFGDGVNIAARLESLAEPGGICVSRGVRDHLRNHPIAFADLGEQKVKNIAQPVRAFKVRMGEASPDEWIDPVLEGTQVDGPSMSPSSLQEDLGVENVGIELAFWNSIKDSGSVAELEAYLGRYPDGAFSVLAQTRLNALNAGEVSDPSSANAGEDKVAIELAFWEAAKDSGSEIELEAYLERYPGGEFVELAEARLTSLHDTAEVPAVQNEEVTEGELTFWNSIKDSGSCIELEAYLERYPKGAFIELAEARLQSLQQTAPTAASIEEVTEGELTFWNSIKDSGNPDMFRAYLNKYPDGTYAELAQINIELEGS